MNCKPGELAFVAWAPATPDYLGVVVKTIRLLGTFEACETFVFGGEERFSMHGGLMWEVERCGSLFWGDGDRAPCPDKCLRPIRPDAEPESTTTPRELEAA